MRSLKEETVRSLAKNQPRCYTIGFGLMGVSFAVIFDSTIKGSSLCVGGGPDVSPGETAPPLYLLDHTSSRWMTNSANGSIFVISRLSKSLNVDDIILKSWFGIAVS
jgi:hypothetical protein